MKHGKALVIELREEFLTPAEVVALGKLKRVWWLLFAVGFYYFLTALSPDLSQNGSWAEALDELKFFSELERGLYDEAPDTRKAPPLP